MKKITGISWKRLTALLLCVSMLLIMTLLSGCAQDQAQTSQGSDETTPTDSTTESVQTEPVVFVVRGVSDRENKTDNEAIYEMIKEQSGIDFEVRVKQATGSAVNQYTLNKIVKMIAEQMSADAGVIVLGNIDASKFDINKPEHCNVWSEVDWDSDDIKNLATKNSPGTIAQLADILYSYWEKSGYNA